MRFKQTRLEKGLTQAEVATILGISRSAYTNIENRKREADYETLKAISNLFDVSTDYLLGKEEPPTKAADDITFDDFTYAMHGESKHLSNEAKETLLKMAKMLKEKIDEREENLSKTDS